MLQGTLEQKITFDGRKKKVEKEPQVRVLVCKENSVSSEESRKMKQVYPPEGENRMQTSYGIITLLPILDAATSALARPQSLRACVLELATGITLA